MKIEQLVDFVFDGKEKLHDVLIPKDWGDKHAKEFIKLYQEEPTYPRTVIPKEAINAKISLALCVLSGKKSWAEASKVLEKDGWHGASLSLWQIYTQKVFDLKTKTVLLPGVRYRDNDFFEWVPLVSYHTRILRKAATKISMKHISVLTQLKERTLFISKIEILKT